jgi:hypothetical protein
MFGTDQHNDSCLRTEATTTVHFRPQVVCFCYMRSGLGAALVPDADAVWAKKWGRAEPGPVGRNCHLAPPHMLLAFLFRQSTTQAAQRPKWQELTSDIYTTHDPLCKSDRRVCVYISSQSKRGSR